MKKSTKIIIAVVSVLLVAAIVTLAVIFIPKLFKSKPKDGFFKALDNVSATDDNAVSYEELLADLKKFKSESFETNTKITMNVEVLGMLEQYKSIAEVLNNVELNANTKIDLDNSTGAMDINVKYDGDDLGTLEAILDGEKIGIKFAELSDKYYTMDMDDLKGAASSAMGESSTVLDESLSKVNSISSMLEDVDIEELVSVLDIKDSEINRIIKRYEDVLKSTLSEDNFSSSDEKITINGKEVKTTAYTVKISDKDLIKIIKAVLKSMKDDTETINLVVEKTNKIMKLMGQSSSALSKNQITEMLESLSTSLESSSEISLLNGKNIKITFYDNGKDVVRTRIEYDSMYAIIDALKDGDTTKGSVKVKYAEEEMTLFTYETTYKNADNYSIKLSTDIRGAKLEFAIEVNGAKLNAKLNVEVAGMIKATINVESTINFTSVTIPTITYSNSKSIKSLTSTDSQELTTKAISYINDKIDVIKKIATVLGYGDQIEALEQQLKAVNTSVALKQAA